MDAILKKSLALLEKNVEWVALGLAALFLLWMAYDYALQKPVTSTVAGQQLTPGEVDNKVLEGPATQLRAAMATQTVPPQLHPPEDFVAAFEHKLDPAVQSIVAFAAPWTPLPSPEVTAPPPEPEHQHNANPVVALIQAPAPDSLKVEQGRSNVQVPPAPAANAGGNGSAIVQSGNTQGSPSDRNWVSISAMIRTKPLAAALEATKVPAALKRVTILRVDLVRQEQDANGQWGPDQIIDPLPTVNIPPLPDNNASPTDQVGYVSWAEKQDSQQALLQPPFFTVLQADAWVVPGLPQPQSIGQLTDLNFDPANYKGDPDDLTPDQRKIYDDYQKQQQARRASDAKARAAAAAARNAQRSAPRGPAGLGGPPGGIGGGQPVVDDPERPLTLAQAGGQGPYGMPPGFRPPGMPPGFAMPPGFNGMPMPQGQQPGNGVDPSNPLTNPQVTLPAGAFDPTVQPDIVCWAHDDSVAPGKTYRYKLRYLVKNPVFQTSNVAQPQSLAQQFEITSADSDWTDTLSVRAESNLFAVNASPLRNFVPVKFDIFRWKNGAWQQQTVDASAGDEIGSVDPKTQTDFSTGLTLVDVHTDPRNIDDRVITLTTDSGQILQHDLSADRASVDHKKLKASVMSQPKAPANPGNPESTGSPAASAQPQGNGRDQNGP